MINLLLMLAIMLYGVSFFELFKYRNKRGIVEFIFLFWLHFLIGSGYLLIALYRYWEWGPRLPRYAHVEFGTVTYIYVSLLCLGIFILNRRRLVSHTAFSKPTALKVKPFSLFDIAVIASFLLVYLVGCSFNTIGRGGEHYYLPFRLNGIIEVTILFLIPFYISLRVTTLRWSYWVGLAIITVYAVFNIALFGSKNTAVFPLIIFLTNFMATRPLTIRQILVPIFLIVSLYVVLNPYYFSSSLQGERNLSVMKRLEKSIQSSNTSGLGTGLRILLGIRNLANRITGVKQMQDAVDNSVSFGKSVVSERMIFKVNRYYNGQILYSGYGTSDAVGHFGFFMFMFRNHVLGFLIGCVVLILFFQIACYFDYYARQKDVHYPKLQGITFVMLNLEIMTDGNYDNLSGYLKIIFGVISTGAMTRVLLREKRFRKSRKKMTWQRIITHDKRPKNIPEDTGCRTNGIPCRF